ncbi:MAG TPA: hypothetical protein VFB16_14080 [Bauldia sp.]|nr:hypothetical protein [Bauldia sp.]
MSANHLDFPPPVIRYRGLPSEGQPQSIKRSSAVPPTTPAPLRVVSDQSTAQPQKAEATVPTVDVVTVGKVASALVGLVCAFSTIVWLLTGFALIYPPMGILVAVLAGIFFVIGMMLEAQWEGL